MWRCSDCGHEYDNTTHNCGECTKPRDLSTYSTQNLEAGRRLMNEKRSDAVDSEEPDVLTLYGSRSYQREFQPGYYTKAPQWKTRTECGYNRDDAKLNSSEVDNTMKYGSRSYQGELRSESYNYRRHFTKAPQRKTRSEYEYITDGAKLNSRDVEMKYEPFQYRTRASSVAKYQTELLTKIGESKMADHSAHITDHNNVTTRGNKHHDTVRLVLLGRTGSGKSATGNTILRKEAFDSKVSSLSVTQQCERAESWHSGRHLIVVDTPGLYDTTQSRHVTETEIIRCIQMSSPGPHAFLLVVRTDRFTQEERNTFEYFFQLFGENMKSFAIIIFTRLDDLEMDNINIDHFLKDSSNNLKQMIQQCGGRYVAFNNKGTEREKADQLYLFLNILTDMMRSNNNQHYSNDMYVEAGEKIQERLRKAERKRELEKQKEIARIESNCKKKILCLRSNKINLKKELSGCKEEVARLESLKVKEEDLKNKMQECKKKRYREIEMAKKEEKEEAETKLRSLKERNKDSDVLRQAQRQHKAVCERIRNFKTDTERELRNREETFNSELKTMTRTISENYNSRIRRLEGRLAQTEQEGHRLRSANNKLHFDSEIDVLSSMIAEVLDLSFTGKLNQTNEISEDDTECSIL